MEAHIDPLRIKSKLSLMAYVEGLKENNMVEKVNFIYLSEKIFHVVIQGLLMVDGVYGIEPKENIIGKRINGVYCKLIKGTKWDKELVEEAVLNGEIDVTTSQKDYVWLGNMYKRREDE